MPGLFFYIWWSVVALVGAGMLLRVFLPAPSAKHRAVALFGFGMMLLGLGSLVDIYAQRHVGVDGVIFIPWIVMRPVFWLGVAMFVAGGLWLLTFVKKGKKEEEKVPTAPADVVDRHREPSLTE